MASVPVSLSCLREWWWSHLCVSIISWGMEVTVIPVSPSSLREWCWYLSRCPHHPLGNGGGSHPCVPITSFPTDEPGSARLLPIPWEYRLLPVDSRAAGGEGSAAPPLTSQPELSLHGTRVGARVPPLQPAGQGMQAGSTDSSMAGSGSISPCWPNQRDFPAGIRPTGMCQAAFHRDLLLSFLL